MNRALLPEGWDKPKGYANAVAAKGTISVPVFKGREWGVGKMLTEAAVYGAISAGLGYLAWRPEAREALQASRHGER